MSWPARDPPRSSDPTSRSTPGPAPYPSPPQTSKGTLGPRRIPVGYFLVRNDGGLYCAGANQRLFPVPVVGWRRMPLNALAPTKRPNNMIIYAQLHHNHFLAQFLIAFAKIQPFASPVPVPVM